VSWRHRKSEKVFSTKYFSLSVDECETAEGKIVPRYYVVDFPDWVQVVALTAEGELVLVDQYRYPGKGAFLEFPGGTTDANRSEDPLAAGKRELVEETGYSSDDWLALGMHYPNPALQTNRCYVFLARDCVKTAEQKLDPFEELTVKLMAPKDFIAHSRQESNSRQHSLMLATLFLAMPYLEVKF
jgi:ADP-ribose pyrophosphatase